MYIFIEYLAAQISTDTSEYCISTVLGLICLFKKQTRLYIIKCVTVPLVCLAQHEKNHTTMMAIHRGENCFCNILI